MNTYRAVHPSYVAIHGPDPFELDLSPAEEADAVDNGHFEIVPGRWRVVGPHTVWGRPPGDEFDAALKVEVAAALIAGGHIEPVDPEPAPKPRKRATKAHPDKE